MRIVVHRCIEKHEEAEIEISLPWTKHQPHATEDAASLFHVLYYWLPGPTFDALLKLMMEKKFSFPENK